MKAIDFPEANRTFHRPPSMTEEECHDLRIYDTGIALISCWEPSEAERKAIAEGAPIQLWVIGRGHPPVAITVAGVPND